ncbi:MAG TPA: FAD:protein FMN transferase [Armatimonadota bacterium]|nr:FAD:protein FMN transferase [Armatimonadota bacterium]
MATRFELVLNGEDPVRLRAIGEEALGEIERLDRQLSFYRPESDVSSINARAAKEPVKVEPRLFRLLVLCRELSLKTSGAFDITIAPLMRAWGFAGGKGKTADSAEVKTARKVVGMGHLKLDNFTIRFESQGMAIDLGAIGKGYAIEQAAEILRENGIEGGLIHGGTSTVYAIGVQADGSPWRIALADPLSGCIDLRDSSLSISAVHGKSFTADGIEFGHVLDPRTGKPVKDNQAAAVVGPSATICDALSTALLVAGKQALDEFPDYCGIMGGG